MSKRRTNSEEELRNAIKRVRTKETIGNNKICSKKHDETHLFSFIPQDLIVQILLKVPARSIVRLVLVSKLWSSIICGKGFTKLYLTRSSTRPRLLFLAYNDKKDPAPSICLLKSCPQEDPPFDHHKVNINRRLRFRHSAFSPLVRGLICHRYKTKVIIGNPSTGQFVTLPNVISRRMGLYSFFGYDPVSDVYKVLCMTVLRFYQSRESLVVAEEHQVFTLGAKQKWRRIECKHPHLPRASGDKICIKGVVYYYAWIKSKGSLISFNLKSEEFNVIKLPEDIRYIVNYNGKIALTNDFQTTGTLNMWVLEDASKQEWSKVSLLLPSWIDLVGENLNFLFRGTLGTGELIFQPYFFVKPFYYISFNLNENNARKVVVEGIVDKVPKFGEGFHQFEVYFDHVESPMILPNVS